MASTTKLRPLHDRVIVKRIVDNEKTASGIIIPDTAKEKPTEGEVLAVGNGTMGVDGNIRPLEVKVGDRVLFEKWSSSEIKIDGEELLVLKEEGIIAVVNS